LYSSQVAQLVERKSVDEKLSNGKNGYLIYRFKSCPDYKKIKIMKKLLGLCLLTSCNFSNMFINYMKNENLKAIVGLVVAIALVVVMAYILKLTNNI